MDFEKPNLNNEEPSEEEKLKRQNQALNEGIEELDKMKSVGQKEKEETKEALAQKQQENFEKQEGIEKLTLSLPGFTLINNIKTKVENGKVVEIMENIEEDGIYSYGENAFQEAVAPLEKAGIDVEYEPWTTEDGEENEGYISIDKDSFNQAIESGKLKIEIDEDGDMIIG